MYTISLSLWERIYFAFSKNSAVRVNLWSIMRVLFDVDKISNMNIFRRLTVNTYELRHVEAPYLKNN
jgi:hypothetical protein